MQGGVDLLNRNRLAVGADDLGFGIGFGLEHLGLRLTLSGENRRLLRSFSRQDRRLLLALGGEDRCTALPLGLELLLHGLLDRRRRIDRLQLHAIDPDAPLAGGFVEHPAQLAIDGITGGERLLEVHRADHVAQRGDGQLLDTEDVAGDLVGRGLGIGHLEVHDRVDRHNEVVLSDHWLRRERRHLLAHVHALTDPVDERDQHTQPWFQGALVAAKAFDDRGAGLVDDDQRAPQQQRDDQYGEDGAGDESDHGDSSWSYSVDRVNERGRAVDSGDDQLGATGNGYGRDIRI